MVPIQITTLTPNQVQQSLQNNGLAALGLTTVSLNTRWADATPNVGDYNQDSMTLAIAGTVRAPFLGIRENGFRDASSTFAANAGPDAGSITLAAGTGKGFPSPVAPGRVLLTLTNQSGSKVEIVECTQRTGDTLTVDRGALGSAKQSFSTGDRVILRLTPAQRSDEFYEANGARVDVNCTIFRLHPQAVARLRTICASRYSAGGQPLILPIPVVMIVRGAEGFRAVRWYRPDEQLDGVSGVVSFHDNRGFIIDPLYVAGLFADLQTALPGLVPPGITALANGAGGVQSIANIVAGSAVRVHFIDPHGNPPRIASPGAQLITTDNGGNSTGDITTNLITLATNDRIAANSATTPLRWGWATNGTLASAPLFPPALANGTIARRFYRVMVVDTPWYLLGNRTTSQVLGIRGDDGRIPAELQPIVRDKVDIDYLVDGPDTLAEAARVLQRPQQNMILAVSPFIDQGLLTPNTLGAAAHWPLFPTPNTNAGFPMPPVALSPAKVSAAFTSGNDVVLTVAGGAAPDGAHIRIYPQRFIEIASINGQEPSFVRADGGAGIVSGNTPTQILLRNPFNLQGGQQKPNPAVLTMDIVVAPRVGRRRLTGGVSVNVGTGPATPPTDPFFGPPAANIMGIMPITQQGVSEQPLFGIPKTIAPPPQPPSSFLDLVVSLLAEEAPRQAARLPTMGRLETVAVTGTTGPGTPQPTGTLFWEAVLTGARWSAESRSALHESGNPGNPAGPDIHAPAVFTTGALAYDLAQHAIRRTHSIIPRPTQGPVNPGWVVATGGDNFDEPSDAANAANTGTGVLLESIAAGTETPWLGSFDPPPPDYSVEQLVDDIADKIGVPPPDVTINIENEPRIQKQIRREFFAAKYGFRDAQWSLLRAFSEARELIYIESPQFARTARPTDPNSPQPFEVDLVQTIKQRLVDHSNLRVIICTPRFSDFAENFRTFHRQHYNARMEAFTELQAVAKDRVLLFHPVGFPGRVAFIRTTSIVVDDVWCLVGTTHFRRRGMTFDGSAAIASFDRQITDGYSTKVRNYRRALMAAKMRIPPPAPTQPLDGEWVRLGSPASSFEVVKDLLDQGGYGRIQSIWPGPPDNSVLAAQPEVADPDGSGGEDLFTTLAGMLNELGT